VGHQRGKVGVEVRGSSAQLGLGWGLAPPKEYICLCVIGIGKKAIGHIISHEKDIIKTKIV
jgi:hypothetical protein